MVERYTDQQLLDAGLNPALLPIVRRESGGKNVGWEGLPGSKDYAPGGTDLSGYPLKSTGFPAWPGKMGPEGNSTAAGPLQIVGSTWDPIARKLGITDFSLESNVKVANELYRQSGTAPWRASEPGYRGGGGGTPEGYYEGAQHVTVRPHGDLDLSVGGTLLLSNILKQSQQAEEPSGTGNALLDGILKAAATPQEEAAPPQQQQPPQPAPVAPPPLPTVAPELQLGQPVPQMPAPQVPSGPMTPIPRSAPMTPMPGQPSVPAVPQPQADPYAQSVVPGTQDNPFIQEGPGGAPVGARDVPGSLDRNRFWNEPDPAPYNVPGGPPDDREQQASTGNSLLDRLLKQFSPISTAQAAETGQPAVPKGMVPGNIDLHARPVVRNPDGSISTVRSMSFNEDGKEVLIPTVAADGSRILTPREAIDQYHRTGQFLGKFDTPEEADAYGQRLHEEQAKEYAPQPQQQAPPEQSLTAGSKFPLVPTGNRLLDGIMQTYRQDTGDGVRDVPPLDTYLQKPREPYGQHYFERPADQLPALIADPGAAETDVEIERGHTPYYYKSPFERIQEPLTKLGEAVTPYVAGFAPGTSLSSGLRGRGGVPPRIEPPPIGERPALPPPPEGPRPPEAGEGPIPRIGQSTGVAPFSAGGQPPALPPTGVARMPGAEPPPEGPGIWREGRSTIDEPRPPKGDANESGPVKELRLRAMHSTQDLLWKNWTQTSSYINKLLRQMRDLSQTKEGRLTGEQKLQMERYLEWQPGMPQVAIEGQVKKLADEFVKPMRDQAAADYAYLKSKGVFGKVGEPVVDPEVLEDLTEGYLHRIRANRPGEMNPFDPFGGARRMRRNAPAQEQRKWYVVQDEAGNRHIYQGDAPKPGTPVYDNGAGGLTFKEGPYTRKIGEVRRATTEEVEKNSDVRYLHDPVLASFQNMAQLRVARWNYEVFEKQIMPMLKDAGLASSTADAARRLGHVKTNLPALEGHYFTPRVAEAFNDFHTTPGLLHPDVARALAPIAGLNRTAINLLFLDPLPHMRNVLSDYVMARGDLWWPGERGYRAGARAIRDAFKDVYGNSKFYHQVMEAGGGLMGASNENRVLYEALWKRAQEDLTRLPNIDGIARSTGIWQTGKDMAKGLWNRSQSLMWGFHDMLMLAHVRELMALNPKLSLEQAVQQAERFVANYRVPATIGEGSLRLSQPTARVLSRLMQDRDLTVFGRYHYNKLKLIGNVIGDANRALTRRGIPFQQRKQALERLGTLLLWSTVLQGGLNYITQQVTGNPEARVPVPGAAGIPANMARVAYDLAWKQDLGQAAYDFWGGMASIISPLPLVTEAFGQWLNSDWRSTRPIAGKQLPAWQQAAQRGAHAAKTFLPPLDYLTDWRPAVREFGGISLPNPQAVAAARRPHPLVRRGEERNFWRNFGWMRDLQHLLGPPPQ